MKSKKKIGLLILSAILLVAFIVAFVLRKELTRSKNLACAVSIHQNLLSDKNISFEPLTEEWKEMDKTLKDEIMSKIVGAKNLDCRDKDKNGLPTDSWGNEFRIAYKTLNDGKLRIMVWSNGYDGVSKTEDDIISPSGSIPPF